MARNGDTCQDFLTEEAIINATSFIHYIFDNTAVGKKEIVFNILGILNHGSDDDKLLKIHKLIAGFKTQTIKKYSKGFNNVAIGDLINDIVNLGQLARFRSTYPQYKQGNFLEEKIYQFTKFLQDEFDIKKDIIKALKMA